MSKQKESNVSKTEVPEVTENLVEQSELEGISNTPVAKVEEVAARKPEIEKPANTRINTVTTQSLKANQRMNVARFLSYYPQNIYVEALLKNNYPRSFFTVEQWFAKIEELLNRPIYN